MHPIEHLRHLARAGDIPPEWLVPEAAAALRGLTDDRHALVLACRKLLEHHARCGPLWWLCGHVLTARDPRSTLVELADAFDDDPTSLHLSLALADLPADGPQPQIVETSMAGRAGVLTDDAISVTGHGTFTDSRPVWVVAGVGTLVAHEIFVAVSDPPAGRAGSDPERTRSRRAPVLLDPAVVDRVIRPTGVDGAAALRGAPDAPFVPELLARD